MDELERRIREKINTKLIAAIKPRVEKLKPDIDWNQVEFAQDFDGNIIALESSDPALNEWLKKIKITRQDDGQSLL